MPVADIKTWLDFAIQQMAAEAYLDQFTVQGRELRLVLRDGNNDIRKVGEDQFAGQTRFVDLVGEPTASHVTGSAQAFAARYQIVHHHANDATGFSATLMREQGTNNFTLSFRSTEYRNQAQGGDYERDGANWLFLTGADGEILTEGFAFGQLAAMEQYYQTTVKSLLPTGAVLNVTGYSLGAHLATVFTELHGFETNTPFSFGHSYTFNGPGRGEFSGGQQAESVEAARMRAMITRLTEVLTNPMAGIAPGTPEELWPSSLDTALLAQQQNPRWNLWESGSTLSVYADARYLWAKQVVEAEFSPVSRSLSDIPRTDGAFSLITQIVGHASHGDTEYVANSGNHAAEARVFIEDQPNFDGFGSFFGANGDFGTTHSLTLIVDSLALQELFQTITPMLQQGQIESMLWASSNELATGTTIGTSGTAEAKPLEHALDALRRLFLPGPVTETAADPATGGFGNLANRNSFYTNLATVQTALAGVTVTIEPLVELNAQGAAILRLDPTEVKTAALENSDRGLAFRYALTALNPFAVIGADYQGLGHASNGALALFDLATGFGELTNQYLIDRAAFLGEKIELNLLNDAKSSGNIHFKDIAPNGLEITTVVDFRVDQEFLFGSDEDEGIGILVGNGKDDHLYGGGGNDLLEGGDGRDYLQGDAGIDRLDGGEEADTMAGGEDGDFYIVDHLGDEVIEGLNNGTDRVESFESFTLGVNLEHLTLTGTRDLNGTGNALNNDITGNSGVNRLDGKDGTDHLIAGIGNDILVGGTGNNDLLEGGAGFDSYYYNAGDGIDQIEDSDATGKIVFNGALLQGGISTDGGDTYVSLDGTETYVLSGGHLIVNGVLTINADFQSGQLGIQLDDLSNFPTNTGVPTGPFQAMITGTDGRDIILRGPGAPGPGEALFGLGGNDDIFGLLPGDDLLDGGAGDDVLVGREGNDYIDGSVGDDHLSAGSGKDVLIGGAGADVLIADFYDAVGTDDRDYLDGGDGADYLWGGWGTDVLLGGAGDDSLRGDNLPDGWPNLIHSDPNNSFIPAPGPATFSASGAADFLNGGGGNDLLVGDGGDDILSGGADNDQLFGDDETGYLVVPGDDVLDGGVGDDLLAGGDGADSLSGGAGLDQLFGDKGVDVLDGGDDVDMLHGGDGADELFGGAGDDLIFGDGLNSPSVLSAVGGADFLDGGAGNDHLEGGIGDDAVFAGTGNDLLFGDEGADSLFGDDGNDELQGGEGNDLLGGDAGDDRLFGQDGADALYGDEGNDRLAGNDGNDSLVGGIGNDILEGGKGTDVLIGGSGHDTYNFSLGDGQDTITDTALAGEGNVIQFFSGITLQSLTFVQDQPQQTLTIQVAGGDSIRLLGFDPNTFSYVVDTLDFADGTVVSLADQLPLAGGLIEGTDDNNVIRTGSGDDTIFAGAGNDRIEAGAGNDVLIGGTGNDVLNGGAGHDTYLFNPGDGTDIVSDGPGEGNRLVFGPGVSTSSVTLGLGTGDSLSVHTGVAGDAIRILASLEARAPSIDSIEFADGTTLSIGELFMRGIEITGTAGADTLTGTSLIDRISGGAGNDFIFGGLGADIVNGDEGSDQLFGGDGDDLLDGGAGADVLWGDTGQDTYVFGHGYGQDIMRDSPVEQSGPNMIQLTSGVSPDEVRLQARQSEDGIDVVLTIDETQDELTLLGAADPSLMPISQIFFPDGTGWDTAEILNRIEGVRLTASASGSFLEGTEFRDELIGAQGNDDLDGLGGADRMVGRAGDDHYWVNNAGDTVVELDGEGADTVLSQIDYTLPEHVENLFLRSTNLPTTDPVRGEGNASDNLLLGNFVNNVLIGEAGNDIFWGGFSIGSDYGPGDDDLYGGAGNDTYVVEGNFNGFDTIYDAALPGEGNRLQFGNSFLPEDVLFIQQGSTLRITNGGGANGAILVDFDPSGATGSLVTEVVAFSGGAEDVTGGYETGLLALMNPTLGTDNGEAVMGISQAEVVKAQGGNDVIEGDTGNDVLLGGSGNDTYVFNQGDGFDLIDDQPGTGDTNTVQFGAGITQEMLRVSYSGTSSMGGLTVRVGTSEDGLHFLRVPSEDPTEPHAVDTFHFADGTQLTFAQLFDREVLVQGTGRSDGEMFGTFADDRMLGLSGSEALSSGDGNDTLIGGTGNDVLDGGGGSDTYVFNPGDGLDEILDDPGEQDSFDVNRLQFGTGITASDLTLFNAGDGFTVNRIAIGTSGDGILLPNFIDYAPALRAAEFADGVTLDLYRLDAANRRTDNQTIIGGDGAVVLIGGMGNDTILAGNGTTTLLGGAGHDALIGGTGADLFMGGRGNDLLRGGAGHDTYLFNLGDGLDKIDDTATAGEDNRIQFGAGISQGDLTLTEDQAARTLTIQVGSRGTDQFLLTNFDPTGANGSLVVDTLAFADGSTASLTSLLGLGGPMATNGDDTITTSSGDDVVDALAGNDVVDTGAGNDTITGGLGNDHLTGGTGNDTYLFNAGDGVDTITDTAVAGDGNTVEFGTGITPTDLTLGIGSLLIRVGATGDAIHLTPFDPNEALGAHAIETFRFADGTTLNYSQLLARGFDLRGTASDDQIIGTNVMDRISGMAGNDALDGRAGADVLAGGTGNDAYVVDDAGDVVTELPNGGIDQVQSSIDYRLGLEIEQLILTGAANLMGTGNALDNVLTGNNGSNVLDGGVGADVMAGGAGDDAYLVEHVGDVGAEQPNEGMDSIQSSITYTLGANVEDLILTGTAAINGTGNELDNILTGNDTANVLAGDDGDDTLTGLAGNDTLWGGAGHDLLVGGTGTDTMQGGNGHDMYVLDSFGDVVIEAADEGTDTVQSALLAYTLGTNVEHLILTGTGPSAGFGNALKNELTGNSAANLLDGKGGVDRMTGGGGDDLYIIDHAGDTVVEASNEGIDTVVSGNTHSLSTNVENLRLIGFTSISGTGNASDNVLSGLLNLAGNTLAGGAGNDTYVLGSGDLVVEAANGGTDTVQASFSYTLGSNVEHLTLTGAAAINGTGNSLNNTITGNSANNVLSSAGGADTLRGGLGYDTVNGGSGNDIFKFGRGEGQDLVQDNSGTTDKILYDAGINPRDLVISRQANDLRVTIHGSSDRITVQNWYTSSVNRTETIQAGNGQTLLSTQVDQLIQAMAAFTQQTGLTWDQAIDQRPQEVQAVLAASWQSPV